MSREQNIQDKDSFFQAGRILLKKVHKVESIDSEDVLLFWKEVEDRLESKCSQRLRIRYVFSAVAASIAILLVAGIGLWQSGRDESSLSLNLLEQNDPVLSADEVILFASNDRIQLKDESSVKYGKDGQPELDDLAVKKVTEHKKEEVVNDINQIVVPKGRKADIIFSDGTKMYVNAGTRVFYPAVFKKDKREILVEGEVFLEVEKDSSRPFIVKTNRFEVKVLGTQFNVCAYKEDAFTSVVLVNGSVEVNSGKNNRSVLSPNQMIKVNDKGTDIKEVDVFEYICWKDNMMMLNGRKVGETLDRLSRYYGRNIWYNEEIGNIPISGKLDLRENMEDVINIICQSMFLQYKTDANNNIIISK